MEEQRLSADLEHAFKSFLEYQNNQLRPFIIAANTSNVLKVTSLPSCSSLDANLLPAQSNLSKATQMTMKCASVSLCILILKSFLPSLFNKPTSVTFDWTSSRSILSSHLSQTDRDGDPFQWGPRCLEISSINCLSCLVLCKRHVGLLLIMTSL